ncbi:endonuclease/exonuclease/phosphatase family domain-containing protein 1 [Fopius arisanus]|uniref:Endonuclease/exonuclease/phosphatase family domain-containing protein 1 n=1 Tax=Fopius arisanus TaxID=64838 RepID=A0A0C9RHX9_9HYME|nr:PREDICTED: endonuclease/exonuclease/phosphatase family domain-containing protein 1-like [Fopius arisanus]
MKYSGNYVITFTWKNLGIMGQSHSAEGRYKLRRPSFKQITMGKRRINYSKNLSHTFSFPDETIKPQQLNINTATEEELMTLPGITRNIAVNIVSHRRLIGRFNRIEDVALVSGVGAQKLENIKLEVYVTSVNGSGTSSRASTTLDSMGNTESPVDVNLASVFDLQTLPGVDQELASRIVEKRAKHGWYHSLDEIAKLRGMGKHRFAMIKPHLKINVSNGLVMRTPSSDSTLPAWDIPQASSTPRLNNVGRKSGRIDREEFTEPIVPENDENEKHFELSTGISEKEIWELLSIASPRPSLRFECIHRSFVRKTIRIASWNLTSFTADKASNPGVMEVVCRTILENQICLLALQEVKSPEALEILTNELNLPTLKRVRDWRENKRKWHSVHLGAGLAVLWDADPRKNISLREQPPATKVFLPVLASMIFHINKIDLTIINVQMHGPDDMKIIERFLDAKNSIFLGDFSWTDDTTNCSGNIMIDTNTAVNSDKYFYKDRIIWREDSSKLFDTGLHRVVRQGLMHLGIPQGWRWGGPASDHCPVWCEIFTEPSDT